MTALRVLLAAALLVLAAACGVEPQPRPVPVPVAPPTNQAPAAEPGGPSDAIVYFVRDQRLAAVRRDLALVTLDRLLEALASGPTRTEVLTGVRTAVAPQYFSGARSDASSQVAVVTATDQFAAISGEDQVLAMAQLVWTVTEAPGVSSVRLIIDGRAVDVPTDEGLTGSPVDRDDFSSVAPASDGPGSSS